MGKGVYHCPRAYNGEGRRIHVPPVAINASLDVHNMDAYGSRPKRQKRVREPVLSPLGKIVVGCLLGQSFVENLERGGF